MPIFFKLQRPRTAIAEEADVEGLRRRCVRSSERATWRNGHVNARARLGSLQRRIPRLWWGSYFPLFLQARKVSEKVRKALFGVIQ